LIPLQGLHDDRELGKTLRPFEKQLITRGRLATREP
jgi:hypothetical protein